MAGLSLQMAYHHRGEDQQKIMITENVTIIIGLGRAMIVIE